jgi:hypothetical protein
MLEKSSCSLEYLEQSTSCRIDQICMQKKAIEAKEVAEWNICLVLTTSLSILTI